MKTNEISKSFKNTQNQIIKAIKTLDSTIDKRNYQLGNIRQVVAE